jgi:hypothetical protein
MESDDKVAFLVERGFIAVQIVRIHDPLWNYCQLRKNGRVPLYNVFLLFVSGLLRVVYI